MVYVVYYPDGPTPNGIQVNSVHGSKEEAMIEAQKIAESREMDESVVFHAEDDNSPCDDAVLVQEQTTFFTDDLAIG